jgi:tetratricopeptide (TPR) repeat protein
MWGKCRPFLTAGYALGAAVFGRILLLRVRKRVGQRYQKIACNVLDGIAGTVLDLGRHVDQAATFYERASELDPDSVVYRAKLATALSELGRCEEADEALSEADYDLSHCSYCEGAAESAIRVAKSALGNCSRSNLSD